MKKLQFLLFSTLFLLLIQTTKAQKVLADYVEGSFGNGSNRALTLLRSVNSGEFIFRVSPCDSGFVGLKTNGFRVQVYDHGVDKTIVDHTVTNDNTTREAHFFAHRNNLFSLLFQKEGYLNHLVFISTNTLGSGNPLCVSAVNTQIFVDENSFLAHSGHSGEIGMGVVMKKIKVGDEIPLDSIYYDYDKATLRPRSKEILSEYAKILFLNPIEVELGSHTDNRGSDQYNISLSDRRAKAAVDYLIELGVPESQITARGYGESRLAIKNTKNEAEHQINRRTAFRITGYAPEKQKFDMISEILVKLGKLTKHPHYSSQSVPYLGTICKE